jgi:hypothetical protein
MKKGEERASGVELCKGWQAFEVAIGRGVRVVR